ncbi:hypothetical protein Droror1_Dr00001365 [Drosera rotundifolia]
MALPNAYPFEIQDDTKIIRSVREAPRAHYLFEIESFALLKSSISHAGATYLESTEFEAANYKWVLVIYPNGNQDDDGAEDHISLYLKLIDQLGHGYSVNAAIKFCIYDYNRNTYLIIHSLAEQRYNVMEKQKGIARALPLSDFTSSSNGFIKRDRCKFGIEVFVADTTIARTAICSTLKERTNSVYTWPMNGFQRSQMLNTLTNSPGKGAIGNWRFTQEDGDWSITAISHFFSSLWISLT